MSDIRIVDLEVIKRFSLAVRQEFADADEVIEALEASLDDVRTVTDGAKKKRSSSKKRSGSSRKRTSGSKSKKKSTAKRTKSKAKK